MLTLFSKWVTVFNLNDFLLKCDVVIKISNKLGAGGLYLVSLLMGHGGRDFDVY